MNKKLLASLLTALILFLAAVFTVRLIQNRPIKDSAMTNTGAEEKEEMEIKYSRVTFFNTQAVKASMSIPESWEGKYRLRDRGSVVHLYYIGEAPLEAGLLEFKIYSESNWQKKIEESGETEAGRKDSQVITYKLSTMNVDKLREDTEYKEMREAIIGLIKTIKIN